MAHHHYNLLSFSLHMHYQQQDDKSDGRDADTVDDISESDKYW